MSSPMESQPLRRSNRSGGNSQHRSQPGEVEADPPLGRTVVQESEIGPRELDECPMSQAQMMFLARENNIMYSNTELCEVCGYLNAEHPMQGLNESPSLLQAVFNPVVRIPRPPRTEAKVDGNASSLSSNQDSQREFQISKMIQSLSEHQNIKETWNPSSNMLPQLFLRKYETYMSQLAANMPIVWIRLLPSTLHKSIKSEFEWVNKNICQHGLGVSQEIIY